MNNFSKSVDYIEGGGELLELIASLWTELNGHHQSISEHFSRAIAQRTFDARKEELIQKGRHGHLRVDLAQTLAGKYIGYCVSSIDCNQTGEIDSIFVLPPFRNEGIGDILMRRAMTWMDGVGTVSRVVEVAWGNEQVWSFYQRYGFLPRSVRLVQKILQRQTHCASVNEE